MYLSMSKFLFALFLHVVLATASFPNCNSALGPFISACAARPIASALCSDILHRGPPQTVTVPSTTVTITSTNKVIQTSSVTTKGTSTIVKETDIPVSTFHTVTTAQQGSTTVTSVSTSVTTIISNVIDTLLTTATSDFVALTTVTDTTTTVTSIPVTTTVNLVQRDIAATYNNRGLPVTAGIGISKRVDKPHGLLGWLEADIEYACSCLLGPPTTATITKGSVSTTTSVYTTSIVTSTVNNEAYTTTTNTNILSTETLISTITPVPTTFITMTTLVSTVSEFSTSDLTSTVQEIDTIASTSTVLTTVTSTTTNVVATATNTTPCSATYANSHTLNQIAPALGPFTFYYNPMTTIDCCEICFNTDGCINYSYPIPGTGAPVSFTCGVVIANTESPAGSSTNTAQCPFGIFTEPSGTPDGQFDVGLGPCGKF